MTNAIVALIFGSYLVAVYWLSVLGMRKTKSLRSFAVGNKDMSPVLVGVVMASSIASTATFVINPGFVYTHGLSAFLHYGVAAQAGMAFGLIAVTKGFRRVGDAHGCLTIPDWIRSRYGSKPLALFFALVNLLSITFVVLIMVGCALLVVALTGISYSLALVSVLLVVFSYVLMGGTYAHAYTNVVQAAMMAVVALVLFGSGVHLLGDGFVVSLQAVSPHWAAPVNPESNLYASLFSVFVSAFVVTFALMMQPHILTKVLYLRSEKDVTRFLVASISLGFVFSLALFVGFYAKLRGIDLPLDQQDSVVTTYVAQVFGASMGGELVSAIVLVALLAAGMSTLDGILVALSAMVTNDLYLQIAKPHAKDRSLLVSRIVLVGVGLVAFALALDPPRLVGLFAQKGVYGLAAASFVPIVFGVLVRGAISARVMGFAAVAGLAVHLALDLAVGIGNPAVSACYAILASVMIALLSMAWLRARRRTV